MARRSSKIRIEQGDAVEFIHQVNSILEALVDKESVGDVVFVTIKNWFDHKWLHFSGKSIVHFEISHPDFGREEALEIRPSKHVTIPPFNPHRVLHSKFMRVRNTGNRQIERTAHGYRRGTDTSKHLVSDYTSDGLLLWYSSNTLVNQKGSVMVYISKNEMVTGWYASFENNNGWRVARTKGISADYVRVLASERVGVIE